MKKGCCSVTNVKFLQTHSSVFRATVVFMEYSSSNDCVAVQQLRQTFQWTVFLTITKNQFGKKDFPFVFVFILKFFCKESLRSLSGTTLYLLQCVLPSTPAFCPLPF